MSDENPTYKETEYFQCMVCKTAYVAMLMISLRSCTLFLCGSCHSELRTRINDWNAK